MEDNIEMMIAFIKVSNRNIINMTYIGNGETVMETKRSRQILTYKDLIDLCDTFSSFDRLHNTK